jgi:hypothetical protein
VLLLGGVRLVEAIWRRLQGVLDGDDHGDD